MDTIALEPERINTAVEGSDHNDDIFISEDAINAIIKVKAENDVPEDMYLRLGTSGGGCSGMNYIIGFDSQIADNDNTYTIRDHNIVIDKKSLFYLMGVTLDFVDSHEGSGFVFNSPFNEKVCGCNHG